MTKARKGIMWSLIAVLAALLVALAAIGVTFARYSSEGEGSGSASVAKWDVAVDSSYSAEAEIKTFSPSEDGPENVDDTNNHRSNTSDALHVAQITNSGNVTAAVTIEGVGALTYVYAEDACTCTDDCGCTTDDEEHACTGTCTDNECDFCTGYAVYADTMDSHFSLTLYSDVDGSSEISDESIEVASSSTADIYAVVTWTSDTSSCYGAAADAFDTWCGHYLEKITFTIHFTAVQTGTSNTGDEP